MALLILLRHGQSMWNAANLFTGWVNVPLSAAGMEEALSAGRLIAKLPIDRIYTSTLIRAQQTAMLLMNQHASNKTPLIIPTDSEMIGKSGIYSEQAADNTVPTYIDWRLNERYYGELQGKNKAQTIEQYGAEQVHIWRRSYDIPPPGGDSLETTAKRTVPCFTERIEPDLQQQHNCLVSAHGNSLRSIVMHIEQLSPEEVIQLELPTGQPRIYEYTNNGYQRRGE